MKKLAEEFGVTKMDALNCVDCQLGGKGTVNTVDPEHNLMFMGPGMIEFFQDMKPKMIQEGLDEETFQNMFSGIKGFVILDTCGDGEKLAEAMKKTRLKTQVLEVRKIGTENVSRVIADAIERS
jgi:hypothetical protein